MPWFQLVVLGVGGALIGSLQKVDRPVSRWRPGSSLVSDGLIVPSADDRLNGSAIGYCLLVPVALLVGTHEVRLGSQCIAVPGQGSVDVLGVSSALLDFA